MRMSQFQGYANTYPPYGYAPPWQPPAPYYPQAPLQHFTPPEKPEVERVERVEVVENNEVQSRPRPDRINDLFERLKQEWTVEELNFSMNRISMAGLILGLMFLGSIFFLLGFLVAVNLYTGKPAPQAQPRTYMPTEGAVLSGRTGTQPLMQQIPGQQQRMPMQQDNKIQSQARIPSFQPRTLG